MFSPLSVVIIILGYSMILIPNLEDFIKSPIYDTFEQRADLTLS